MRVPGMKLDDGVPLSGRFSDTIYYNLSDSTIKLGEHPFAMRFITFIPMDSPVLALFAARSVYFLIAFIPR